MHFVRARAVRLECDAGALWSRIMQKREVGQGEVDALHWRVYRLGRTNEPGTEE